LIFVKNSTAPAKVKISKSWFFLKVKFFLRLISTTFEFSRQIVMQFLTKIDISTCQIWLKLQFFLFEILENPSF